MKPCCMIIGFQRFGADLRLHPQRGPSRKSSWTTYMVSCPGRLSSATLRLSNFSGRIRASFSEVSDRSQPSHRTSSLYQISREGAENKPILVICVGVRWTHLPGDNSRDGLLWTQQWVDPKSTHAWSLTSCCLSDSAKVSEELCFVHLQGQLLHPNG
jgi:hypothetical protein